MLNKSSMLYWYPRIKDLEIPQPKTIFAVQKENWWDWLNGIPYKDPIIFELKSKAKEIGYPVFMRTDHCSGKHDYVNTCYVSSEDKLILNLYRLIEANAIRDLWFTTIILREFIELDWQFKAFSGFPIAPERRYFVSNGQVDCHHPYWPIEAIEFYQETEKYENTDWQNQLHDMNYESEYEIKILSDYAQMVSNSIDGSWSVDFAKGLNGTWYLIDMAEAEKSYHQCHKKMG